MSAGDLMFAVTFSQHHAHQQHPVMPDLIDPDYWLRVSAVDEAMAREWADGYLAGYYQTVQPMRTFATGDTSRWLEFRGETAHVELAANGRDFTVAVCGCGRVGTAAPDSIDRHRCHGARYTCIGSGPARPVYAPWWYGREGEYMSFACSDCYVAILGRGMPQLVRHQPRPVPLASAFELLQIPQGGGR